MTLRVPRSACSVSSADKNAAFWGPSGASGGSPAILRPKLPLGSFHLGSVGVTTSSSSTRLTGASALKYEITQSIRLGPIFPLSGSCTDWRGRLAGANARKAQAVSSASPLSQVFPHRDLCESPHTLQNANDTHQPGTWPKYLRPILVSGCWVLLGASSWQPALAPM